MGQNLKLKMHLFLQANETFTHRIRKFLTIWKTILVFLNSSIEAIITISHKSNQTIDQWNLKPSDLVEHNVIGPLPSHPQITELQMRICARKMIDKNFKAGEFGFPCSYQAENYFLKQNPNNLFFFF